MKRNRIIRLLAASGAAVVASVGFSAPANALLFTPCTLIGAPWAPPPCIVMDYKKISDIATQVALTKKRIEDTINTVQQAKATTQGMVSDVRSLTDLKLQFDVPRIDTNMGPLFSGLKGNLTGLAQKTGEAIYAGVDATTDSVAAANSQRRALVLDSATEAYAYGMTRTSESEESSTKVKNLYGKACKAKDLRSDLAANSDIKLELITAQTRNAELLTAYLKMKSATAAGSTRVAGSKTVSAGSVVGTLTSAVKLIDESAKVRSLIDLVTKAQGIMGSLQVVEMSNAAKKELQDVIVDYEGTVRARDQKILDMRNMASRWGTRCRTLADTVLTQLNNMNSGKVALSQQEISTLIANKAFSVRGMTEDHVASLLSNDVDPRQFLGSWADVTKYEDARALAKSLGKGQFDSCVDDKDGDRVDDLMDMVGGYSYENKNVPKNSPSRYVFVSGVNDLMLEEAWKKVYADQARQSLAELEATAAGENQQAGVNITPELAAAKLNEIIAQVNGLNSDILGGQDDGSKARAEELIAQLKNVVTGGAQLPSGNVDGLGGSYANSDADADAVREAAKTMFNSEQ